MLKIKKMLRAEKGFTLIELLIVVAIIAILATMALSGFGGTRDTAQEDVNKGSKAVVQSAVDRYYFDKTEWPRGDGIGVSPYSEWQVNKSLLTDGEKVYIRNWPEAGGQALQFKIDSEGRVEFYSSEK